MKQILLSSGLWTLVSNEDFLWVLSYSWRLVKGYPARNVKLADKQQIIYLHHEVAKRMNLSYLEIDHKDRNKLNCQRDNLRPATSSQNKMNRSGVKGYCWHSGKWRAYIKINKKQINLGRYETEAEARTAYENAARKYFGEFANI